MAARRKKFDFDAALDAATTDRPIIGSRNTELAHPQIHEWVRRAYERQRAGRIDWATARAVIAEACRDAGLPPLRSSATVVAHYARRKFRG